MDFPTLKVFLDVVDEALPQLVVAASYPLAAGLSQQQFDHFIAATVEAAGQLVSACEQLSFLYSEPEKGRSLLH